MFLDLLYENYQYICDLFKHEFVLTSSDFQVCVVVVNKKALWGIVVCVISVCTVECLAAYLVNAFPAYSLVYEK